MLNTVFIIISFFVFSPLIFSQEENTVLEFDDSPCTRTQEPFGCFQQGRIQYDNGEMEKAKESWEYACLKGALSGFPVACSYLADLFYDEGDREKSLEYYGYACQEGSLFGYKRACYILGNLHYETGLTDEARSYFEMGCGEGEGIAESCANRGNMAVQEEEEDHDIAAIYWGFACEGDLDKECFNLGLLYELTSRIEQAEIAYSRACELGNPGGCGANGVIAQNQGRIQDAKSFFQAGCDLYGVKNCLNLGVVLFEEGNIEESLEIFTRYCERSNGVPQVLACNHAREVERFLNQP